MNGSMVESDNDVLLLRQAQAFRETHDNTFLNSDSKVTNTLQNSKLSTFAGDDQEFVENLSSTIHGQYILNAARETTINTAQNSIIVRDNTMLTKTARFRNTDIY